MSFFQNIISSIMRSPLKKGLFGGEEFGVLHKDIDKALEAVMSTSGEVSSLVYAEHLLNLIEALNDQDLITFLQKLSTKYDIDPGALSKATVSYSKEKTQANLEKVTKASEPLWVELFRRLNTTQDGTVKLVRLRERIRVLVRDNPEIAFFNSSLLSLFKGWFNPSFLVLEKIDWSTPANILEKIIEYEAVHEINSWDDLRARLAPDDRRCFAFFHPLIPDEPLIFVEVALCTNTPESINEVIKIDREIVNYKDINTAVFYSISNCQDGLSGISFGNFLIKQVAHKLKQEVDTIEKFVTLSPVPGFVRWLESKVKDQNIDDDSLTAEALLYLTVSEREDKLPNDPVARFHLGNGAILEKINLNADLSKKGILQSKGMMVNYLYNLELLEKNHELFFKTKIVQQSDEIKSLKKKLQIHT
tara:strand:- start:219 stop:1472 length:1254 start_codon:yes stop_codon:yes gene_type:complete